MSSLSIFALFCVEPTNSSKNKEKKKKKTKKKKSKPQQENDNINDDKGKVIAKNNNTIISKFDGDYIENFVSGSVNFVNNYTSRAFSYGSTVPLIPKATNEAIYMKYIDPTNRNSPNNDTYLYYGGGGTFSYQSDELVDVLLDLNMW